MNIDRDTYMMLCKHNYADMCELKSGWSGWAHITVTRDGKCRRMRNYYKKNMIMKTK